MRSRLDELKFYLWLAGIVVAGAVAWGVLKTSVAHNSQEIVNTRGTACDAEDAAIRNETEIVNLHRSTERIERVQTKMDEKLDAILERVK